MASPSPTTLHTVCKKYGPGRLPKAENRAIGAGYVGATAAICVALLYAGISTVIDPVGLAAAGPANILVAALFLPFAVPAAFIIGVCGWKLRPPQSAVSGLFAGVVGAVATYGVVFVLLGIPITAGEAVGGADPIRAVVFSWGVIYFAFMETWWIALPVGAGSLLSYVTVVESIDASVSGTTH